MNEYMLTMVELSDLALIVYPNMIARVGDVLWDPNIIYFYCDCAEPLPDELVTVVNDWAAGGPVPNALFGGLVGVLANEGLVPRGLVSITLDQGVPNV